MTKQLSLITLMISSFIISDEALGQIKVSDIDLSFQYNVNSGLRGKMISSKQDTSAILRINFDAPLDSLKKYSLSYSLVNNVDEVITTKIELKNLASYFQFEDENGSQYGLNADVGNSKYLILWLSDTANNVNYPFIKLLTRHFQSEDILLYYQHLNAAIFQPYLPINTNIRVVSMSQWRNSIQADFYDYHFMPAKAPMSKTTDSLNFTFKVDKSFMLNSNDSILLSESGLYYFHLGESQLGQSIIIRDEQYPRVSQINKLVESLRYLATDEEYQKMSTSFNKKDLFDEFWLNNTKSEAKARRSIKEYYQRVKDANLLFTTFKEGWKTDMGMIYILFGPPSKVFVRDAGIMWIYNKTFELPRLAFFFNHMNTAFTDQHFVLERKAEYQNLWFRTVDLWRSGKKDF
jgi:GWxTD domain-containing protein